MRLLPKIFLGSLFSKEMKTITNNIIAETVRKNHPCLFNEGISKEEFYVMANRAKKGIRRIANFYVERTIVSGTVHSQSGLTDWNFKIDFNDYGKLTGRYWLYSGNDDSSIPKLIASRITQQIRTYPDCVDESFKNEVYGEEVKQELQRESGAKCPYCGKRNKDENAKFCSYCGIRFRA